MYNMNENNDDIFKYLPQNGNDKFSFYSGIDLQDLVILIDEFSFSLRDDIGISKLNTFGFELECEYANLDLIFEGINPKWKMVPDSTLIDGIEINSPILTDSKECWEELKEICKILSNYSKIGKNSSGHIHIGRQAYNDDRNSLIKFIGLWILYEHIIFRFSNGEFLNSRPSIYEFACPVRDIWKYIFTLSVDNGLEKEKIIRELSKSRYYSVNFFNYNTLNTIEFRCPNGTFNPVIWQNNVNLFTKLLLSSGNNDIDFDMLVEKINNLCTYKNANYNEIYLKDALEFVDLIFDNNLDKIYFLKQYLKSFEVSDKYEKAKIFS